MRWFIAPLATLILLALAIDVNAQEKIDVQSDSAFYSADGKRAQFDDNVVVIISDVTVHADKLLVSTFAEGNRYQMSGAPIRVQCGECMDAPLRLEMAEMLLDDETNEVKMEGDIMICAGFEECAHGKLFAERAQWQRIENTAQLYGAPVHGYWIVQAGEAPFELRAKEAHYDNKNSVITLLGEAAILQGAREIRGGSIRFNIKTKAIEASGGDSGRARGIFNINE